jgi:hypothetical protein
MKIQKKEDGTLIVPQLIEQEGIIGDAFIEIMPGDPEYEKYLQLYERDRQLDLDASQENFST